MATIESGYLLIADITGYTAYLSASELEHAQEILSSLLELLVANTKPPLILSRLAGDAVISYALGATFKEGQTFVEMLEQTYVAFRRAIELMVLNNSCRCNACANVSNLDLKFFVHYGEFGIQRLSAHDELVGSDVNLIHRLLKNHVTEETGLRAYALYTERAIEAMGLQEGRAMMRPLREEYEHLGEVLVWVQDMQSVWQAGKEKVRVPFPEEKLIMRVGTVIGMPAEQVWDYLAAPEFRAILLASTRQEVVGRKYGRVAEGSVYRCYHGDKVTLSTVLEWRPFERLVTQDLVALPVGPAPLLIEYRLEAAPGGTRLTMSAALPGAGLLVRLALKAAGGRFREQFERTMEEFRTAIEQNRELSG